MYDDIDNKVQMLQSMMGEMDAETVRQVLMRHNGDIEAAATAMLDTKEITEPTTAWPPNSSYDSINLDNSVLNPQMPRRTNTPRLPEPGLPTSSEQDNRTIAQPQKTTDIIDLTADLGENDGELARALQMSLEQEQPSQTFQPSNRAPDPNWAMVPSNVASTSIQENEDHSLNRAIEASLSTSYLEDRYEEVPLVNQIRWPGQPCVLRISKNEAYFAPPVFQALFYVPQVCRSLSQWRWKDYEKNHYVHEDSPEFFPQMLSNLYTYMSLSLKGYFTVDEIYDQFECEKLCGRVSNIVDNIGELSNTLYSFLARQLESHLNANDVSFSQGKDRLFHLRYGPLDSASLIASATSDPGTSQKPIPSAGHSTACVRVEVPGATGANELLTCLSNQLGLDRPAEEASSSPKAQVLVAPSEVIAFELVRTQGSVHPQTQAQATSTGVPFKYPMRVYLDPFLSENIGLATVKRDKKRELEKQINEMLQKRDSLTVYEGKDTLKSLSSTLYYYENIARKDTPKRQEEIKAAVTSLRQIVTKINGEVKSLDDNISKLKLQLGSVFDDPELQKHRYDLRAVLVHDGLVGRSHIHSFVQHMGKWWKLQDTNITEVSKDEVLHDSTGLHLGGGPYMLIYSRETEDTDFRFWWPTFFKNGVQDDNRVFIDEDLERNDPEAARSLRKMYETSLDQAVDLIQEEPLRRSMSAMSGVEEGLLDPSNTVNEMDVL